MVTLKGIGITTGLITGTGGIAGGVAYLSGAFDSKTQITELIKKENKHALLTDRSTNEEWKTVWDLYKASNKAWGEFTAQEQAPDNFKQECSKRGKGTVSGIDDPAYQDITKYCGRDKTIADLLEEQSFKLLDTKNEKQEWQTRFDKYKEGKVTLKLNGVNISSSDNRENDYTKLTKGCEEAVKVKTAVAGYENNITAIKEWCKGK